MQDLDGKFFGRIATKLNMELASWRQVPLDSSGGVITNVLDLDTTIDQPLKGIYGFELNGHVKSDVQDGVLSTHEECHKASKESRVVTVTLKIKVTGQEVNENFSECFRHRGQDFVEASMKYLPIIWGIENSHTAEVRLMQRLVNHILISS